MAIAASLDLHQGADCLWDAIVVGAGPAGSMAARELARRGVSVLLVDKMSFPRWKVCGSCLNRRTLATLASSGLGGLTERRGAASLNTILLATSGRQAAVPLPGGVAVSRTALDAGLIEAALAAGVKFVPGVEARLGLCSDATRGLILHREGKEATARARLVLLATGLGAYADAHARTVVQPDARIGAGAIADEAPLSYQPGTIFMGCGLGGYIGLVRLEDGRLNIAAALDATLVKEAGGLGKAADALLREAGLPVIPGLAELAWRGTPRLTRSVSPPAARRLFLLGDAAGYVEPFTGEGIGWALESAVAVAPLAHRACRRWNDSFIAQWARLHRQKVAQRWWACRATAEVLRRPGLTRAAIALAGAVPGISRPIVGFLNAMAKDAS
jgi:flavin-dependent dehydrogenase